MIKGKKIVTVPPAINKPLIKKGQIYKQDTVELPRVETPIKQKWIKGAEPFNQKRYNLRNDPITHKRYNLRKPAHNTTNFKDKAAKYILAQHIFTKQMMGHVYNTSGKRKL